MARSRYAVVPEEKSGGMTYTPDIPAHSVARKMVETFAEDSATRPLRLLDPAVGDGELLIHLSQQLAERLEVGVEIYGFDTEEKALQMAQERLGQRFPTLEVHFVAGSFLEFVLERFGSSGNRSLLERFYDHRFHNKLYAGRRRFITQYVEEFPLPAPQSPRGRSIIARARQIYNNTPSPETGQLQKELDDLIWESFGLER